VLSGKIFEYLCSGRPVLSVAHPEGLASKLVAELGAGWCADVRDRESVTSTLREVLARWQRGQLEAHPGVRDEVLRRFSRRKLAAELANVLRATVDGGPAASENGRAPGDASMSQPPLSVASA
jgi:glycosyltransferase involved in cell wall biosynthesis